MCKNVNYVHKYYSIYIIELKNVITFGKTIFKSFYNVSCCRLQCVTSVHLDFIAMKYVDSVKMLTIVYKQMEHACLDVVLVIRVTSVKLVSKYTCKRITFCNV